MTAEQPVRATGAMEDLDGMLVQLGVDFEAVTIHAGIFTPGGGIRLNAAQRAEFKRLFNEAAAEAQLWQVT